MPVKSNYKRIRVTMEVDFYVPMASRRHTAINGWTIEEVIQDWFKKHDINSYHATRIGHEIGNSKKIKEINVLGEQK